MSPVRAAPGGGGDRHLEAAAGALNHYLRERMGEREGWRRASGAECAQQTVTAYLSSLLGELPEEAVEAASDVLEQNSRLAWPQHVEQALIAALASLRDSLASGQGQGQQHEG